MSIDSQIQTMIDAATAPLRAMLESLTDRVEALESPSEPVVGWAEWYWAQHPELDPRRMTLEPYAVTSSVDSGPGTLRDALSRGNRLVSYAAPTTVALKSDIVTQADNIIYDNSKGWGLVTTHAVKFEGTGYVFHYPAARDSKATLETDNWTLRGRSGGPVQAAILYGPEFRRAADGGLDVIYSYGRDVYVSIWDGDIAETDKALLIDSGDATKEGGRYHVTIGRTRFYDCGQRMPAARNADVHLIDCLIERFGDQTGAGGGATAMTNCNLLAENCTVVPRTIGEVVGFNGQTCTKPRLKGIHPHFNSPGNVRVVNPTLLGGATVEQRNPDLVEDPPYR